MENNKILAIIIIFLTISLGISLGFLIQIPVYNHYDYQFGVYACHDGCSIATKNQITGMLTDETFICWEECNEYFNEIKEDLCEP